MDNTVEITVVPDRRTVLRMRDVAATVSTSETYPAISLVMKSFGLDKIIMVPLH